MSVRTGLPLGLAIVLGLALSCAPVDGPGSSSGSPGGKEEDGSSSQKDHSTKETTQTSSPVPNSLKARIEAAVQNVRARELQVSNRFWTIFHAILGLGPGVELYDPSTKQKIIALDYICDGGVLPGLVFKPTLTGGVDVISTMDGKGQGHQDQFIAEMAQWGIPANRRFRIKDQEYAFKDFVHHSLARARTTEKQELSWTIIIAAQYQGTTASWINLANEPISTEAIVQYELNAPIEDAACGGTHRLFGLTWAYHLHLQKGGISEGVWKGVPTKTARYRDLARKFRNADGSFSTSFFRERGNDPNMDKRINTTGHILEWLALALSDDELRQPWVQEAVNALCLQLLGLRNESIDGGSMYHAVHGLLIYYARVFDRSICPVELLVPLPPGWKKV
jgi:hypothetical protein